MTGIGLVLSLFPGIGLLDRGFEDEGFCVVRGPDLLWGGDVKKFHPPAGRFDGVIGGPPCQRYSKLAAIVRHVHGEEALAECLIPEFNRVVALAAPAWFLMENVLGAPEPDVSGYQVRSIVLDNRQVGGVQHRERRFCFGTPDGRQLLPRLAVFEPLEYAPTVLAKGTVKYENRNGHGRLVRARGATSCRKSVAEAKRLQGLPEDFDLPGFTIKGTQRAIGNGVPYPLARAVALAVREAMHGEDRP